ncbi:MAG: hypothetical protein HQ402_02610 [Parcubacteria group bacterium]|nr:hypothetical protein [Parcubacteria group bacterium]
MFLKNIKNFFSRRHHKGGKEIYPDEIFIDSSNLPKFDTSQFEGRLERPIPIRTFFFLGIFFALIVVVYISKLSILQVVKGEIYQNKSENNRLLHTAIFANRGIIFDRNGDILVTNFLDPSAPEFLHRGYPSVPGFSTLLGYVKYPSKDKYGFYYQKSIDGMDGVEQFFNDDLSGSDGVKIVETNAKGELQSESVMQPPKNGESVMLSIDSGVQGRFYKDIAETAKEFGFKGGAGVIMDISSGEILSLVSFPEYDSFVLSEGSDSKKINQYLRDTNTPFLDRVTSGLYTPGSIVKPFVAIGALEEKIIDPLKQILSTGSISLPNPFFPDKKSVFTDWKAHGWVDMRKAIAVSSDVYFYEVGGGFGDQKGLGIYNIEKYADAFGFQEKTGINLFGEKSGVVPDPEWKKDNFNGEDWRVGDTYFTAIGQYGFQVTPLEAVRAIGAIANEGTLVRPNVLMGQSVSVIRRLGFAKDSFKVAKEGMRQAVTDGIASGLNVSYVDVAAKTGTAELGVAKALVNSWSVGFFPYNNPKYAFAVVMEKGPSHNTVGGTYVMRNLFDWMSIHTPQYFK